MKSKQQWWKEAVIYQVYPQSFQDSDGDGIGDIQGLISRLDHIAQLGADVVWLNPVYKSPLDDNGYDISDYYRIHPMYGTMEDFDLLLEEMHARGLKLIMDLVVNHCSDEHEWFVKSRQSTENPYRDYFFWRPGKNGGPPNNWISFFGGSAWEYDPMTDEYFLHIFTKRQPDLNWENPKVRKEVYKIMHFWLKKGIDGFRMDVISLISKHTGFPDSEDPGLEHIVGKYYANGPRIHEYLKEMYQEVLQHYDVMTVGEGPGITDEIAPLYVGEERDELNMIFQLEHMFIDWGPEGKFDPVDFSLIALKEYYTRWNRVFEKNGWITSFLDNHDFPRMVSRFGNDGKYRVESAKLLATLILTMPGTPCIYFGSEIGMTNAPFASIDQCRDVETLNFYKILKEKGMTERDFMAIVRKVGRDNVRTPMQWDDTLNAGFTSAIPWIMVNPNYPELNVQNDLASDDSIYAFYREMIQFRKKHPCLVHGSYTDLAPGHPELFAFRRVVENEQFLVLLNFSDNPLKFTGILPKEIDQPVRSNYSGHAEKHQLRPWEAQIFHIQSGT